MPMFTSIRRFFGWEVSATAVELADAIKSQPILNWIIDSYGISELIVKHKDIIILVSWYSCGSPYKISIDGNCGLMRNGDANHLIKAARGRAEIIVQEDRKALDAKLKQAA